MLKSSSFSLLVFFWSLAWASAAAVRWLAQGCPASLVSISDSGFGIMSLSCSGVKLPVGGLLESGGLCLGCSAASRWMALDSGRSCVQLFFVDYLSRVPPVMSGLHGWGSGRPLFFTSPISILKKFALGSVPMRLGRELKSKR